MSIAQIANDLVELCKQGKNLEVIDKYYADEIVSVESMSMPGMPAEMTGLKAVKGKNIWWLENHEVQEAEVNGPFLGETQFAVEFKFDVTQKATGQRMKMAEMAIYTVENGKITREHFYYAKA